MQDQQSLFKAIIRGIKHGARVRELAYELDYASALALITSECYYCGSPPKPRTNSDVRGVTACAGGIDRINSKLGYVQGNVVPCCHACNVAKGSQSPAEFKALVDRIAKRWGDREFF